MNKKSRASGPCIYCSDCFNCPLPDCRINDTEALRFNRLQSDGWGPDYWERKMKNDKDRKSRDLRLGGSNTRHA